MGGIVVGDQMLRFVLGRFTVDFFQESQPLSVSVALLTPVGECVGEARRKICDNGFMHGIRVQPPLAMHLD